MTGTAKKEKKRQWVPEETFVDKIPQPRPAARDRLDTLRSAATVA